MSKNDNPLAGKTLTLLWERARQQGDLPGFAKAITAILGAMRGEDDREFNMTQTVLSDPALTQKVLRLANSAMYAAFGQAIGTVSKAVIVLGTETIGHLALGLKLIDELSAASPKSHEAHLQMEKAVLAGQVARQVATSANYRDTEEAVVCSMLHSLGRMMTVFYLADRWELVCAQMQKTGNGEDACAVEIMGLTLEDIGRATAERWGLPRHLIGSMRHIAPAAPTEPISHGDWLAALSTMASACADALCEEDDVGGAALDKLANDYAHMLGVEAADLRQAVEAARPAEDDGSAQRIHAKRRRTPKKDPREHAARVLAEGVSDMHDALERTNPSQMMAMALETVLQGLQLSHSVAFLRNRRDGLYAAKMSFGGRAQQLLPLLQFEDAYQPDTFHAALSTDRIIYIENAHDPKFAAKLPQWWKQNLAGARSFIVLPLAVNNHATGFIYGDWTDKEQPIKLEANEFMLLNSLRALVVKSIERRHRLESAGARD